MGFWNPYQQVKGRKLSLTWIVMKKQKIKPDCEGSTILVEKPAKEENSTSIYNLEAAFGKEGKLDFWILWLIRI